MSRRQVNLRLQVAPGYICTPPLRLADLRYLRFEEIGREPDHGGEFSSEVEALEALKISRVDHGCVGELVPGIRAGLD